MRVWLLVGSGLLLLLAACSGGNALMAEEFPLPEEATAEVDGIEEAFVLPETLRSEDLLIARDVEERQDGLLRLIVEQPGRNQNGALWLNLAESQADAAFQVRARIRAGQLRLWLRTDDRLCSGYVLIIDPTLERYRLSMTEPDCTLRTLADRSRMEVNLEQWYEVTIEARGNTISGTVDSVRFFEVEDDTFSSGEIALQAYTDGIAPAQIEVDWLRVLE